MLTVIAHAAQARLLNTFTSQPSYTDEAANADFALVTLTEPIGNAIGWMGLEYPADGTQTVDLTTTGGLSSQGLQSTLSSTVCS